MTRTTVINRGGGEANPDLHTNPQALKRFQDNRFGMFIHWGPVALRGEELSWSRGKLIPKDEYDELYREFNPVLFSPEDWVNTAKNAGMRYIVLTTRHHDGFCLWPSRHTDYTMAGAPCAHHDIVGELALACKKAGIDFGTYYSVCDWKRDDYPMEYPYPEDEIYSKKTITDPAVQSRMNRYIEYMKNQLKELIDNVDPTLIWFDGEWEYPWTHEAGMDLYAYLRGLKDELLINNRVDKGRDGMEGVTKSRVFAGDFGTPEQQIGSFDTENPWETCMTIGTQWSWKPNDRIKSAKECIQSLLRTAGGDGNLLFNVGPMPDGRIERRQINRLEEMGDWLKVNGEAVYASRGGPYMPTDYMVSTRSENRIYLHLFKDPGANFRLPFPGNTEVTNSYVLDGNHRMNVSQEGGSLSIELPRGVSEALDAPDHSASVLVLELSKPAAEIPVIERSVY